MKRHAARGKFFVSLASSTLHPWARSAIVLLALVQIIAPMWHVCALAGGGCHDATAHLEKVPCHDEPVCPYEAADGSVADDESISPTGQWISAAVDNSFHGTCLALLLMGMPSSASAPFHFAVSFSQRNRFAPSPLICPTVATLPQPPSRGPPLFGV